VVKEKRTRHMPGKARKPESRTEWDRLDRMTDEEIERAALDDPDAQPLSADQLARAFRPGALIALRKRLGLSQAEFSRQFMLNQRTLQDWEQGRRAPENIARAYLRVIEWNPDEVRAAMRPTRRARSNINAVSATQTSISVLFEDRSPQVQPPRKIIDLPTAQAPLSIGSLLSANSNNPSVSCLTNRNPIGA